jgi:hypothetical protein
MGTEADNLASLAALLHAECLGRNLSPSALAERFSQSERFKPLRSNVYAALRRAAQMPPPPADRPLAPMAATIRQVGLEAADCRGPVLLVCESAPFWPDLGRAQDQILLRLLAGLEGLGVPAWILRTPRAGSRPLLWLLAGLPERPAGIVAVGVSNRSLEALTHLAPVVLIGPRSMSRRAVPCVEHDARLEAAAIASYAADHGAQQVAFVAGLDTASALRRMTIQDVSILSALIPEAHNRHIAVPVSLTWWVETGQSLEQADILPRLIRHARSRILPVVSGPSWTAEAARALGNLGVSHILCRHWSAIDTPTVPVVGPDLDRLVLTTLTQLLGRNRLPANVAAMVAPAWHQGHDGLPKA